MEHRNSGVQSSKLKLNAAKLPLETSINDGKVCQNGPYTLPHTLMAFGHLISPPLLDQCKIASYAPGDTLQRT